MSGPPIVQMPQPIGLFAGDLFARAQEYLSAFEDLTKGGTEEKFPHVSSFLMAHAIELLLKSFLAANNVSKDDLQRKFGHKLCKARDECEALSMPDVQDLKPLVERLNDMNDDYDFRYPSGYHLHTVPPARSLKIAKDFSESIREIIATARDKAFNRHMADTREIRRQGKKAQWSD
jgi:hypothetical protein